MNEVMSGLYIPKKVACIKLCGGALTFDIDETMSFEMPTEEQRKNLKEMLCIEVIPINDGSDEGKDSIRAKTESASGS